MVQNSKGLERAVPSKETRSVWPVIGWRLVGHPSSQFGQGGPLYIVVGKG